MPELPEVQTVVATLSPFVRGQTLACVRAVRADIISPAGMNLGAALKGRTVTDVSRRAKRIIFTLDDGNRFYIHLGMTGRLTVERASMPMEPHTHLVLELEGTEGEDQADSVLQVRFRDPRRFGGIFWLGTSPADAGLGPEPLTLRSDELSKRLAATRRPIKAALLDQALIAGLGNIYADEALFAASIHPLVRANQLTRAQVACLNRSIKKVLRQAIRFKGSTLRDFVDASGAAGSYRDRHNVYDREGESCPRCRKHTIQRIVLTGRSTCFCPRCQPR